ncbi:uncharacterized protein FIESC28_10778 [Fusarium coffeatum]|uniref:Xylanolytic transcriptional activator regulatory domain-containing protein n=1 Tax=Fusarium coffeatum TaxID=231269 RepID=A0A366QQT3_9HYPO|nr:uncharacterized protein FIESC28_10778 [Fusarium coffeatum]RBR07279.1 hypothetical protein FIESC28_10778 [Fusarium coffeatum]
MFATSVFTRHRQDREGLPASFSSSEENTNKEVNKSEKCIGAVPCERCSRLGRSCEFSNRFRRSRIPGAVSVPEEKPPVISPDDATGFFEVERIQALEHIVRHFTGLEHCNKEDLETVMSKLSSDNAALPRLVNGKDNESSSNDGKSYVNTDATSPSSTVHAEFSHAAFSRRLQQRFKDQLNDSDCEYFHTEGTVNNTAPPGHLLSRDVVVLEAVSLFPPPESAFVLLDVFFYFAQTNYFYICEETLRQQLDQFYCNPTQVGKKDTAWVCVSLMVFTLGIQFLHLHQSLPRDASLHDAYSISQTMDDTLALTFYRKASSLIPDLLTMDSIESVQAFLLFGIYMLPIDPAGLSCTYFGIAVKAATQFSIQQRSDLSPGEIELQKRVWWTAYALERLTILIEDARDIMLDWKATRQSQCIKTLQDIIEIRERHYNYWQSLSQETCCRDLTPGKPLFRSNVHLALTYHLFHILIGRSFVLDESDVKDKETSAAEWLRLRKALADDCVNSAVATINLCQLLKEEGRLSKSSYTEFSSCCAAILVLVARCVSDKSRQLQDASKKGMELLREISTGVFSTSSEKSAVAALEAASERLILDSDEEASSAKLSDNGYRQFREWVATQQIASEELQFPRQENQMLNFLGGSFVGPQCSEMWFSYGLER